MNGGFCVLCGKVSSCPLSAYTSQITATMVHNYQGRTKGRAAARDASR
jgi:hypothetical protein